MAVKVAAPFDAGERAAFRAALHAMLVRLACSGVSAPVLTVLLAGHLGCHPVGPPGRCAWLLGAFDDVLDTLEATEGAGALRRGSSLACGHEISLPMTLKGAAPLMALCWGYGCCSGCAA